MEFRKKFKVVQNKVSAALAFSMIEDAKHKQTIITGEQRQFYEDNGYLLIKHLYDASLLDSFRNRFTEICNGTISKDTVTIVKQMSSLIEGYRRKPEDYIYKIQDILYDEVFMKYSEDPKALGIVSQIIGDAITVLNSMLINKPPGSTRHPPHQDLFYFPFRPAEKVTAMWTAIDPSTVENGCLYVIPGTHKAKELLNHKIETDSKKFFHGVADEEEVAPESKKVYLEMEPGDTVFLNSYVVHGSGPNMSQSYRKAMTLHFASSDCHVVDLRGTVQEHMVNEYDQMVRDKGVTYYDLWKVKTKQLDRLKSNL